MSLDGAEDFLKTSGSVLPNLLPEALVFGTAGFSSPFVVRVPAVNRIIYINYNIIRYNNYGYRTIRPKKIELKKT